MRSMSVGEEVIDPMVQRELDWLERRRGMITASKFGDVFKTGRAKDAEFSQVGYSYLRLKVAERLGSFQHNASSKSMQWGHDHEAMAIMEYAAIKNVNVESEPFNFIKFNEWVGGTPDGLVAEDGCVEVKCPYNPANHIETVLSREIPKIYYWQVVGHLLVTGCQWCDFISFDPRMDGPNRICIIRKERDSDIDSLADRLENAADWIQRQLDRIEVANGGGQ